MEVAKLVTQPFCKPVSQQSRTVQVRRDREHGAGAGVRVPVFLLRRRSIRFVSRMLVARPSFLGTLFSSLLLDRGNQQEQKLTWPSRVPLRINCSAIFRGLLQVLSGLGNLNGEGWVGWWELIVCGSLQAPFRSWGGLSSNENSQKFCVVLV